MQNSVYRVRVTSRAEKEIRDTASFFIKRYQDPIVAKNFLASVESAKNSLRFVAESFNKFYILPDFPKKKLRGYKIPHYRYILFYTVSTNIVYVRTLRHTSQNHVIISS